MLRFGDYEFQPDTGELRRVDASSAGGAARLPPQPARLLELLLDRRGSLLEREEIRAELWPDTHVDFDQSLAFCVRQLRTALGDSGSSPTYIETLPRRGFRLLVPVAEPAATTEPAVTKGAPGPIASGPTGNDTVTDASALAGALIRARASRRRRFARAGFLLAGGVIALVAGLSILGLLGRSSSPTRLAIMPFELAADAADEESRARLANTSEWLVVELTRDGGDRLEVVGPRTTASYQGAPFPDLAALSEKLDIDCVLNSRYLPDTTESTLVVELIRLDDGAHVWVDRFSGDAPWRDTADSIRAGVRGALGLPR